MVGSVVVVVVVGVAALAVREHEHCCISVAMFEARYGIDKSFKRLNQIYLVCFAACLHKGVSV